MNTPVKIAVFPVGGLGTRFLPATKSIPKEMLPIASKPLIQYAYEEAVQAGIEQFIFVTGRNKNAISNHFDHAFELQSMLSDQEKKDTLSLVKDWLPERSGNIAFVRQREPLGLGHAVWCARNFVKNEPFAVLLADEMVKHPKGLLSQMIDAYNDVGGGNIIAIKEVAKEDVSKYGIVASDEGQSKVIKLKGMVEKPQPENAPSNLSITGRYILQPEIFNLLEQGKKGSGGEIQLTDAMCELLEHSDFYGVRFDGERFDCGSRVGFLDANIAYSLDHPQMQNGVRKLIAKYQHFSLNNVA